MPALEPGDPQQVGRYRLLGALGGGGMGRVFLGQSPGGRLVAVKLIRAELASDPDFRIRFAREVATARTVSGIFTAPVVDADTDARQPWLVTAYVEGPSLADAVADRGPLPVSSLRPLAAGLAEGLGAIHAAGVVHRDLKPSNVLLASDGPRIIDFGISRAANATALTQAGWVTGSPGFMSPEQAGGEEARPASDIFSLGALLAFAASAHSPFGGGSINEQLYRIVHSPPATDRIPAPMRPLINWCLAKDPRQRPTTDQILGELGAVHPAANWLPPQGSRSHAAPPLEPVILPGTTAADPAAAPSAPASAAPAPLLSAQAGQAPPPSAQAGQGQQAQPPSAQPGQPQPQQAPFLPAQPFGAQSFGAQPLGAQPFGAHPESAPPAASTAAASTAAVAAAAASVPTPPVPQESSWGAIPPAGDPSGMPVRYESETNPAYGWAVRPAPGEGAGRPGPPAGRVRSGHSAGAGQRGLSRRSLAGALSVLGVILVIGAVFLILHRPSAAKPAGAAQASPGQSTASAGLAAANYHDPSGFSVNLPAGWKESSRAKAEVTFTGPRAGFTVVIAWTTHPKGSQLTAWRQQAAGKAQIDRTYRQIAIRQVSYRGYDAADWEFTNVYQHQPTRVIDHGFIVRPGKLAYAIEFFGPDAGWQSVYSRTWNELLTSFTPAS